MRVLALGIVRLHVGFPVVATLEQLPADAALVRRLLRSGSLSLLLDARSTRQDGLNVESRDFTIGACGELGNVAGRVYFRPLRGLVAVDVFGLRGQSGHAVAVIQGTLRRQSPLKDVLVVGRRIPFTSFFHLHSWSIGAFGSALGIGFGCCV